MQMIASNPGPGVWMSLFRVIQLPSSIVHSKKAFSLLLSRLLSRAIAPLASVVRA